MASDRQIIGLVRKAFETEPRPEHFTNYWHYCECAEHNEVLCSRDVASLKVEDVNNAAWEPIGFLTTEGFRYYLPPGPRPIGFREFHIPGQLVPASALVPPDW
jgi:hypothetical protein